MNEVRPEESGRPDTTIITVVGGVDLECLTVRQDSQSTRNRVRSEWDWGVPPTIIISEKRHPFGSILSPFIEPVVVVRLSYYLGLKMSPLNYGPGLTPPSTDSEMEDVTVDIYPSPYRRTSGDLGVVNGWSSGWCTVSGLSIIPYWLTCLLTEDRLDVSQIVLEGMCDLQLWYIRGTK